MNAFDIPPPFEFAPAEAIGPALGRAHAEAQARGVRFDHEVIGPSRAGADLWGVRIGRGEKSVSITAGAHADEPVGPATALAFARWLAASPDADAALAEHTFHVCPNVNPDGAEANRAWFADPLDLRSYLENVIRERPGDDIEFGYPEPQALSGARDCIGPLRPENEAVARFLAPAGPYVFHASLHGMGFAEGAWFLICKEWAERCGPLRDALTACAQALGFGPHDIDRGGEKGFTRIALGYCTTPTATAMRAHFEGLGDPEMAKLFHLSSMEFIQSLGGDPLLMVSELPLFTVASPEIREEPPADDTPNRRFRAALPQAHARLAAGDRKPLEQLAAEYDIRPTSLLDQVRLQGRMILEALEFIQKAS